MANSPIPTLTTGNVLAAGDWNDLTVLNNYVALFGADHAATGTKPALTAPNFLIQAGLQDVSLNGSSEGTITFPNAFPNGCMNVICQAVNTSGNNFATVAMVNTGGMTASAAGIVCYNISGAGMGAVGVWVSYIAIGF